MSIIIRLQNLPLEANSLDIRRFFQGLQIPDGGVHIVGGENGDAFIAFASDEDARQAMNRNGQMIKDSRISLLLSSRSEMQKIIEMARNQTLGIKTIDNTATNTANFINSALLPLPSASSNNIKSNDNHLHTRSPERRQRRSRSVERERAMNRRSRSRSPFGNERDKSFNGMSAMQSMSDRVVTMHSGLMNSMRDVPIGGYAQTSTVPVRSRLGFADAVLPSAMQDNLTHNTLNAHNNWSFSNEPYDRMAQSVMTGSGDFDRDLEMSRDNRIIRNRISHIDRPLNTYTIELRNLPFNVQTRDIIEFFNGLVIPEENVKILIDDRGLTTGGALVRFINKRDFEIALTMNNNLLGNRRIDVQPLDVPPLFDNLVSDRNDVLSQPPLPPPNPLPRRSGGRDLVVYMKGLPYNNCTEKDVIKFFEPIRVLDIVIETEPKGKPTGNAFVEFANFRDYESGMKLNMKHMGRRYIELLPANKDDMNDARRGLPNSDGMRFGNDMYPKTTFCINITGLPATITNRDLTNYFGQNGAQPYAIHIMLSPDGLNAGEAYVEFMSGEHQFLALQRNASFIGNSRITVRAVPYEQMTNVVGKPPIPPPLDNPRIPPSRPPKVGRHDDRFRSHRRERDDKRRGDAFADGRCVVIATNIPYRSSTEDICVFFSDFGITEECISRRFNEKGQPTADAKIAFHSPEDANNAVRQMNKKFLIGRPVFLKMA